MISVATAGGTVINYSPRFSLTGMTGSFPPNVLSGLKAVTGTDGPATENNVVKANPGGAVGGQAEYAVPYTLQTGLTKYAPMQPQPPTKITAKNIKMLWPTSSVVIAKTWLPRPSQVTTFTQSVTYSMSSRENTVSQYSTRHLYHQILWLTKSCRLLRLHSPRVICRNSSLGGRISTAGMSKSGTIHQMDIGSNGVIIYYASWVLLFP